MDKIWDSAEEISEPAHGENAATEGDRSDGTDTRTQVPTHPKPATGETPQSDSAGSVQISRQGMVGIGQGEDRIIPGTGKRGQGTHEDAQGRRGIEDGPDRRAREEGSGKRAQEKEGFPFGAPVQPLIPERPRRPEYPPPVKPKKMMVQETDIGKRTLKLEMDLGGKWLQRVAIAFIILALGILAYYITNFGPWVKVGLIFACGGTMVVVGEYLYSHNKQLKRRYLTAWAIYLILGGVEVFYVGAWRTHSGYGLMGFENFLVIILTIVILNIILSMRYNHPLFILQYLSTFYLTCFSVQLHYSSSDPYFTMLFLVGTAALLIFDLHERSSDHVILTLGFSSVFMLLLMGNTGDTGPILLGGYCIILAMMSFFFREVDTMLGFGKVPDIYWGSMLTLSYLHILNFSLQGGDEWVIPVMYGLVTFSMLGTYLSPGLLLAPSDRYSSQSSLVDHNTGLKKDTAGRPEEDPVEPNGGPNKHGFRFATDLEFYFITGIFFFIFYSLHENIFLLPVFLVTGITIAFFNLRSLGREIPHLLDTHEYLSIGPRKDTLFLLNNRTRFHVFITLITIFTIPGMIGLDSGNTAIVVYFGAYASMILTMGFIMYRRSDEDALQTLRIPIFNVDGTIQRMILDPNPVYIDGKLNQGLKGVFLAYMALLLTLTIELSVLPVILFILFIGVICFLNLNFSEAIARQIQRSTEDMEHGFGDFKSDLRKNWTYQEGFDLWIMVLLWSGILSGLLGLISTTMAFCSLAVYLLLVMCIQLEGRLSRKNAFLIDRSWEDDSFPGLFRNTESYSLFIPFIILILAGRIDQFLFGRYWAYVFFLIILALERYLFKRSEIELYVHVFTVVILGLTTFLEPLSGFVFLAAAGGVYYLHIKEIAVQENLTYVLPIIFLYVARFIVLLNGNDLYQENGMPSPFPLMVEMLIILAFLQFSRGFFSKNRKWRTGYIQGKYEMFIELISMLLLLPATILDYHLAILVIPAGVVFLSLKLDAPFENLLSMGILIWGFHSFSELFLEGQDLILSMLVLMIILLMIPIWLESRKLANTTSMNTVVISALGFLVASGYAFEGGILTTICWGGLLSGLIISGFLLKKGYLRWSGLFIIGLIVLKTLFYDLMTLPVWAIVVLLMAVATAMLGISYLYTIFRERMERKEENTEGMGEIIE